MKPHPFMIIGAIAGFLLSFAQAAAPDAAAMAVNTAWGVGLGLAVYGFLIRLGVVFEIGKIFLLALLYLAVSGLFIYWRLHGVVL